MTAEQLEDQIAQLIREARDTLTLDEVMSALEIQLQCLRDEADD